MRSRKLSFLLTLATLLTLDSISSAQIRTTAARQIRTTATRQIANETTPVGFAEATAKPNIILINLDDADAELFSEETLSTRFPNLHALAGRSVKFNNVHATTPLCGPSRACLLRAQYAHRCGIRVNEPDVPNAYGFDGGMRSYLDRGYASNDLSTWMQDAGYHTIQVGKFLHHQTVFTIPEGWDDFYSSVGGHYYETYRITNRNGPGPYAERLADGVYRTNAEADDSVALIQQRTISNDGKPFFMFLNPYGPHRQQEGSQEMYDAKYANLWNNATMPASPAYDEEDVSDLSGPVKTMNRLNPYAHGYVARHYRERLLAMKSVDDMVGDIVAVLKNRGIEDNTYIFVTSDNGFALGHNRLVSKGIPSNRSTNVPLLVSGPGVVPDETDHLLAHIDLGPTIVQLAGGRTPNFVDGVSFARLIADPQNPRGVRDNVLIENFETRSMFGQNKEFASAALRLKNGLYIEWATGGREYFNLSNDPEQLSNIFSSIAPQTRTTFANILRRSKQWSPAEASFRVPYYDLEELEYPYVLEGIAESTVATRIVKLAIRDMTTQKYWDGNNWSPTFKQVTANLEHRNGILTCWNLPLEFGNQAPTGLVKAWVWGLDWSSNFEAPDTVVFRLGESQTKVSLQSPTYAQRFNGTSELHGLAISGVQPELDEVQLFIRNVNNGQFWNGQSFSRRKTKLPTRRNGFQWSHNASLPQGTYRVSVNGLDSDGNVFDVTHRLFYVDD